MGLAVTLPQFRGKGLASALTRKAMNFLLGKSWISFGFAWKRRIKRQLIFLAGWVLGLSSLEVFGEALKVS